MVWKPRSAYRAKIDGDWDRLRQEVLAIGSEPQLDAFWADFLVRRARDLPPDWTESLRDFCDDRRDEIRAEARERAMDREVGQIARGER